MKANVSSGARTLVTVPELAKIGGIAAFYRALRPHLGPEFELIEVGSQTGAPRSAPLRLADDWRRFAVRVAGSQIGTVVVNPSISPAGFWREMGFLKIARRHRKRVVVYFHGGHHRFEALMWRFGRQVFRATVFHADAVIVLSAAVESRLRAWGYRGEIHREHTVVDDDLAALAGDRAGPEHDGVRVLFLSRVQREKGVFEALAAFQELAARHPRLHLTIAGDGRELAAVREQVAAAGLSGVDTPGALHGAEKAEAYHRADVYVLPSYHEGMPISVLEAMVFGLPVVATEVGGLPDLFESGRMGYLVPPGDVRALAESVERLIERPELRREIGRYNREFASSRFSARGGAKRLARIVGSA